MLAWKLLEAICPKSAVHFDKCILYYYCLELRVCLKPGCLKYNIFTAATVLQDKMENWTLLHFVNCFNYPVCVIQWASFADHPARASGPLRSSKGPGFTAVGWSGKGHCCEHVNAACVYVCACVCVCVHVYFVRVRTSLNLWILCVLTSKCDLVYLVEEFKLQKRVSYCIDSDWFLIGHRSC